MKQHHSAKLRPSRRTSRAAFTLVELIVVVGIVLILTTFTIVSLNVSASRDRVSGSARQIQSFLEGARDRAIFAKEPRGVRFLLDENDPTTVTSMVYIGAPEKIRGKLIIEDEVRDMMGTLVQPGGIIIRDNSLTVDWVDLANNRQLLQPGARIRIAKGAGAALTASDLWYTIDTFTIPIAGERLRLTREHVDLPMGSSGADVEYELELAPTVLPEQEPRTLNNGIVIDLDESQLPGVWRVGSNYSNRMDILFSPRGTVIGASASAGLVHFLIADVVDVELGRRPGDPNKEGDDLIVTLFTRTGHISTHPVYVEETQDLNGNGQVDGPGADPFYNAETGKVAQ